MRGNKQTKQPKSIKQQYGKISNTLKGHKVRSKGEKQIADWLYQNNIRYKYEPRLSTYIPDFFLPDHNLIIEYYGLRDASGSVGQTYRSKIRDKRKYFSNLSVRLVELYQEDLSQLDHIIPDLLFKPNRKLSTRS